MRLLLLNPNTNLATTEAMAGIAREAAPDVQIAGVTAPFGVPLITDSQELAIAAEAVAAALSGRPPRGFDGVVISAFGDPGLARLREICRVPVTGIAEAGMAEAAEGRRRFAVVTTTPRLTGSIAALAEAYGHGGLFLGTVLTEGDVHAVMADRQGLIGHLAEACRRAVDTLGAEAVVIGGGPLAVAARALKPLFAAALVEPLPAAVRLAIRRARFRAAMAAP